MKCPDILHRPLRCLVAVLVTALMAATPVLAQLRIGQASGFTGAIAAGVKENTEGAKLYINAVNARGGVNGQKIELISVDDEFNPKLTVEKVRHLITQEKVLAIFLNRGTPHTQAILPLLEEYKVPLVGPSTGAMALHDPVNPWVFNVRATYQREAAKVIEHLARIGVTRIAILETDDTFGADCTVGALKGFAKANLKPQLQEKFPRDKPDFTEIAKKVVDSNAQAFVVFGSAANTAAAIKAVRALGSTAQAVTLSNNASGGFVKLLGEHARGVIVTQVFPNERSVSYPLIKEAMGHAKTAGLEGVSPAMMEGYAAAKVMVEGLRRVGPNPTPQSLRNALEGIRDFDMGGLKLNYGPENHTGLDFADLSIIDREGRFRR